MSKNLADEMELFFSSRVGRIERKNGCPLRTEFIDYAHNWVDDFKKLSDADKEREIEIYKKSISGYLDGKIEM